MIIRFVLILISFPIFLQAQTDSLNMQKMGELSGMGAEYNDIWGYTLGDKEFAIIGSNTAINIVDVTDCTNPILEHQWVDGSSVIWRDFKEYRSHIYGICDGSACQEGLQVIHKKDFTQSQSLSEFRAAHNIFIDESSGRLYVAGSNTNNHGLWVYDIKTDPSSPTLLKDVRFRDIQNNPSGNYYVHDLYVRNDTAYCSHGYPGFRIWDMTDLDNISLIGETPPSGGYNHSSWLHSTEPFAYVAEEVPIGRPMYVYDLTDMTEPFETLQFEDPLEGPGEDNRPHNPFVYGNRLFISYYHDGIQVYDVSNPASPNRVAYYDTYPDNNGFGYSGFEGSWGCYPFLPSGCILASDITYGLSTHRLELIPEFNAALENTDIIIETPESNGLVFYTPNRELWRLTINSSGVIEKSQIDSIDSSVKIGNANLSFNDNAYGVIFNHGSIAYRLNITDDEQLVVEIIGSLPNKAVKISNQDISFNQFYGGLKMITPGGRCRHFTLDDGGTNLISPSSCDD